MAGERVGAERLHSLRFERACCEETEVIFGKFELATRLAVASGVRGGSLTWCDEGK